MVNQRKLPISGSVTSARTSIPSFFGVELERFILVVDPELGVGELDHGVLL